MYVCICNAITRSELREAAKSCCGDAESLYIRNGTPPQCRQCLEEANEIIENARAETRVPAIVPQRSLHAA